MPEHNDYPFHLSDTERSALQAILAGDPYKRIPFMNCRRNSLMAAGLAPIVFASELRLIMDTFPEAMGLLLDAREVAE